jgi:hypothetical protein
MGVGIDTDETEDALLERRCKDEMEGVTVETFSELMRLHTFKGSVKSSCERLLMSGVGGSVLAVVLAAGHIG